MMKKFSAVKLVLICLSGIILNVAGSRLAQSLDSSLFLDTIGTAFIAAVGGYVPGIIVGLFTNLIGSGFDIDEMYFGLVNIIVAVMSTFFFNKGYYEKFSKVLLTIPAMALATGFFGSLTEELLKPFDAFKSWHEFFNHFLMNFSGEISDKSLAILITFFLLKLIPSDLKKTFRLVGKMQAPVSPEMRQAIKTHTDFILSLRTKIIGILMSITLLVVLFVGAISYKIYQNSTIKDRIRIADGIITMVVNEIDPKRVDEFIELGHQAEGYNDVERRLYRIRNSNSDVKFIYVYKIMEDGCHVVFDLNTAEIEASAPGEIEEFEEAFNPYLDDLLSGKPIVPIISDDTFGHLLTIYKPVYDSTGHCTCYAGIDFSMDAVYNNNRMFISRVILIFSGIVILIFALGLWFIENNIILPINTMAYCARNFAYDSEAAREQNIERIKSLGIKTYDEIENLYDAFLKTTSDSMNYFENLKRSKIQLAVMDELAHKDALTGLKNKAAYNEDTTRFNADIAQGSAEFAIIMIDVNFLKRVNDTYGHERGNEYLINAGKLVCSVFGEEKVYRIGGDEFVVALDREDLARCEELVATLRGLIEKLREDNSLQAWEKVSAAVGVAYYDELSDKTAEDVFKRADADMYKNKLAMKATRRD